MAGSEPEATYSTVPPIASAAITVSRTQPMRFGARDLFDVIGVAPKSTSGVAGSGLSGLAAGSGVGVGTTAGSTESAAVDSGAAVSTAPATRPERVRKVSKRPSLDSWAMSP